MDDGSEAADADDDTASSTAEDNVDLSTITTISNDVTATQTTADAEVARPRPKQKRVKKDDVSDRQILDAIVASCTPESTTSDDLDYFAKSVAQTMRRLNTKQQAVAKLRIQQVLLDVEFENDNSCQSHTDVSLQSQTDMDMNSEWNLASVMQQCGLPAVFHSGDVLQ